jgi:hypothetical protein
MQRARTVDQRKMRTRWTSILIGVTFLLIGGGTVAVIAIVVLTPIARGWRRQRRPQPTWTDSRVDPYRTKPA